MTENGVPENGKASNCKTDYFEAYDNLEVHRLMLSDAPRTNAYKRAIELNSAAFKNKVVMGKLL